MNKKFYLAAAAFMMAATGANAQEVIMEDTTREMPWSWDMGSDSVTIAGATVTLADEAMNTAGLPFGDGTKIVLTDGAKIVMFDSPETWYPNPENANFPESVGATDVSDPTTGALLTAIPWNLRLDGDATIVADSKCTWGGTVAGTGNLTVEIGDSTIINADFKDFTGRLTLKFKNGITTDVINFGGVWPSASSGCGTAWTNRSSKCWCTIPFELEVPNGSTLSLHYAQAHTAFPVIIGEDITIDVPLTLTMRPATDYVYGLKAIKGGRSDLHFEFYGGGNMTINCPIEYTGVDTYIRNKNFGFWLNGTEPTFVNMTGSISVRNNDGFVGGTGTVACGIACKDGITTHIRPGEGFDQIGDLTVTGSIWMANNNAIDVDFGANGRSDRLLMPNPDGACNISGAYTRLWIQLLDEFYDAPKAGNYNIVNAANFVPNTVYFIKHIGTRFADLDAATLADTIDKWVAADSTRLATYDQAMKDSVSALWVADTSATGYYLLERIDTLGSEISQHISWQVATREDGTREDALPEGYSWYPTEWDAKYDSATIVTKLDSLRAKHFFEDGVIVIYGPDWNEAQAAEAFAKKTYVNGASAIEQAPIAAEKADHGRIISSQCYTADGQMVPSPVKGVNIIRNVYEDGTVTTRKTIIE